MPSMMVSTMAKETGRLGRGVGADGAHQRVGHLVGAGVDDVDADAGVACGALGEEAQPAPGLLQPAHLRVLEDGADLGADRLLDAGDRLGRAHAAAGLPERATAAMRSENLPASPSRTGDGRGRSGSYAAGGR